MKCKFPFRDVSEIRWYFLLLHLNCKSTESRQRLRQSTGLIPLAFPMRSKAGVWFSRHSRVCQSRKNIFEKDLTFLFQIWTWFYAKVVWSNLSASTYLRPSLLSTKHIIRTPWADLEITFHPGTLEDKKSVSLEFPDSIQTAKKLKLRIFELRLKYED